MIAARGGASSDEDPRQRERGERERDAEAGDRDAGRADRERNGDVEGADAEVEPDARERRAARGRWREAALERGVGRERHAADEEPSRVVAERDAEAAPSAGLA